jgi:putative FmdB family regulatory protein
MPIYEYICSQCENEFELRLSFNANCTPVCPNCYSEAKQLISGFACKTGSNLQASEKPFGKTGWGQKAKAARTSTKTDTKQLARKTNRGTAGKKKNGEKTRKNGIKIPMPIRASNSWLLITDLARS